MGVWGISNLENDTAKDWLVEIGDANSTHKCNF